MRLRQSLLSLRNISLINMISRSYLDMNSGAYLKKSHMTPATYILSSMPEDLAALRSMGSLN